MLKKPDAKLQPSVCKCRDATILRPLDGRFGSHDNHHQRRPGRRLLEQFWYAGTSPIARGDIVIQVTNEGGGQWMVSPPGTVVNVRKWRKAKRKLTFIYVEVPQRRRTSLAKLAKTLGRGWKKRLHREGPMRRDLAPHLLRTWQE